MNGRLLRAFRDCAKPFRGSPGGLELAKCQTDLDEQSEQGHGRQAVAERVEPPLENGASEGGLSPRQVQGRRCLGGHAVRLETRQELAGLLEPSPPHAEERQTTQAVDLLRRVLLLDGAECRQQLALGLDPATRRDEHAAIDDPAIVKDRYRVVTARERVHDLAPLDGARKVGRAIAGREHVAAGIAHDDEVAASRGCRRHGLIEHRQACVHVPQ